MPRNSVVDRIEASQVEINQQLRESFTKVGVSGAIGDLVNLNFSTLRSDYAQTKAKEIVTHMVDILPEVILRDLFNTPPDEPAPITKITFYDKGLEGIDAFYDSRTGENEFFIDTINVVNRDEETRKRKQNHEWKMIL